MKNGETRATNELQTRKPRHSSFEFRHSTFQFHRILPLLILAGLFSLSGASCPRNFQQYASPQPRVLPATPTLEQVVGAVNHNNSQIRSFSTNKATLSGAGFPSLGASIAFERPRRFRLRAGTGLTGTELDLGSNDDLFWFWARREQPPALYFARHDQLAAGQMQSGVSIDPEWLVEALGIAEFDPSLPHQGPFALPNDRLQIRTIRETPEGPMTKITIVDGSQGWILEQHLYDARRQLLASSIATRHRRDPLTGLVMPAVVQINCPSAKISMRIDLGKPEINRLSGDPAALWSMPSYPNAPAVDLANPANRQPMLQQPSQSQVPGRRRPVR